MCKVEYISHSMHLLSVFRDLLQDPVLQKLLRYLDAKEESLLVQLDYYGDFVAALYSVGGDLGEHLYKQVMNSENAAIKQVAAGKKLSENMEATLEKELDLFSKISSLNCADLVNKAFPYYPGWENTFYDFHACYKEKILAVSTQGYGIFSQYHMLTVDENGRFVPVKNSDTRKLKDLTGYENEREKIIINTKALLKGFPANNILLYGDAGTGKSCTVKCLVNEFGEQGLRLVEIRKNQLHLIPSLMDKLAENPLTFIFFIDDLSFSSGDENFAALKAILEGTVSARPKNVVIYATSNRRHMVKQSFSERQGDDIHLNDTLEEAASLSARFGLTITFLRPDKELFADIVKALAVEQDLALDGNALLIAAEAHASRQGGRSPRVARQFIEFQKAKEIALQENI